MGRRCADIDGVDGTRVVSSPILRSRFASSIAVTRRIGALVARLRSRTLDRLLDGVRRQYAERHRHAGVLRDARESAGALAGDVVEMRRRALDHGAERDDRVVALAERQLARDERQVERAGRAHDLDLLVARAVSPQRVDGAAHQRSTMNSLKRDARIAKRSSRHCRSPSRVLMSMEAAVRGEWQARQYSSCRAK